MHVTGLLKLGVHFGYGAAGGADLLFHPARYLMSLGACKASKKILKAFAKGKNLSGFCKKKEIGSEETGFLLEELLELIASIERFPTIPCLKLDNMSYEFILMVSHISHSNFEICQC